ncbi:SRPBCC family protein [Halorussus halophilus]|uniref:hypothetical protein n=1 Tax=Halorussus halophilus TaxID=2650975 RepID=UPI001CE49976|nr:hypothetical protein [Halorussus halophilus]
MLLDQYLPEYDETVVRHTVVEADQETTYDAMLTTDLLDLGPVVRSLGQLRDLPRVVSDRLHGTESSRDPEQMRIADVPETSEWVRLDEQPGAEYVFGAIGKFWQPAIEWRRVAPSEFREFTEPGYAKLAIGLSVRPFGEGRTLLSYEARTATTDDRAQESFQRYWRVVGPFAGYLMSRALDQMATNAESRARLSEKTDRREASEGVPKTDSTCSRSRGLGLLAGFALAGVYHFVVRPWHNRWGTVEGEAAESLPGDDLLPDATKQVTHAVEIDAPAEEVWPWLVQIGQDRGGFYSYDWLENLVGADIHNVERIVPEYQHLDKGDTIRLAPVEYPVQSPESVPRVVQLDPERAIVLQPPGENPAWTWAFVLDTVDADTTRLLARMRSRPAKSSLGLFAGRPVLSSVLDYVFWEPAHFVMERKMLRGIKRRAERRRTTKESTP